MRAMNEASDESTGACACEGLATLARLPTSATAKVLIAVLMLRESTNPKPARKAPTALNRRGFSVLVRIELVGACHDHDEWLEYMQHLNGAFLGRDHVGQTTIHVRTFIEPASLEHHALLLHPLLHHARGNRAATQLT